MVLNKEIDDHIKSNRPNVDLKCLDGRIFDARAAMRCGMIDGIISIYDVIKMVHTERTKPLRIIRAEDLK